MALCYKDQSFCSSDCKNDTCFRHYSDKVHEAAKLWWGGDDAPIALSDFSRSCPAYIKGS